MYVIDGWSIAEHVRSEYDEEWNVVGWRAIDPGEEQREYDFDDMLRSFDAAMPEELRLGDFLDSVEVPVSELKLGDEVWVRTVREGWEAFPVAGFGQPESNRIAVWVDRPDGRRDITYPDLPYVANYGHDGDFSRNPNNYVHGDTARIRPRA